MERPHPAATGRRADPGRWREADLRFDRDAGWLAAAANDDALRSPWPIKLAGLTLELRATEAGQVGLWVGNQSGGDFANLVITPAK